MTLGSRLTLETSDGCTQIVPGLQHGVAQGTRIVDAGGDARLATRVIISSHVRRRLNRDAAARLHGRADETTERCSGDRKSTRLNSSHVAISYAGFCLK